MSEGTKTSSGGITFGGLLTVLFIGLKLGHVIDWSWWWVLSPIWISLGLIVAIVAVAGAIMMTIALWPKRRRRR